MQTDRLSDPALLPAGSKRANHREVGIEDQAQRREGRVFAVSKEFGALAFATVLALATLSTIPPWRNLFTDVCHLAVLLAFLTMALLWVIRLFERALGQRRAVSMEKWQITAFLAGMPVIYISRWFEAGGGGASHSWLWAEILGLFIYGALAILGFRRWPWLLAVGIALHGIAWDAWHYLMNSAYIPDWYAIACLVADVGLSVYVAVRIPAWQRRG
ncbi:MAG TPA: hypothetical protein VKZ53_16585 [Candidatus Angelobacter sp.]|nr:hypothetical protein [Candidatus Angelobacter sp.]